MKMTEAMAALQARYPDKSIRVEVGIWHHNHHPKNGPNEVDARVSILPGFEGCDCSQYAGTDLATVVAKMINYSLVMTPEQADEAAEGLETANIQATIPPDVSPF